MLNEVLMKYFYSLKEEFGIAEIFLINSKKFNRNLYLR